MNQELDVDSAKKVLRPSRVRFGVLTFACTLAMVSYLDRVCFAKAVEKLMEVLNLNSEADMKWAFTAFAFAYAAFEIPSGWLGDVFGPRNVLIRIVLWWSFFTALTGLVGWTIGGVFFGLTALVVVRFLFGMGEAGTFPNITRALHNWFPFGERGVAQGAVWMTARMMGGLTPFFWLLLTNKLNLEWRQLFWIFGGIGLLWCVLFMIYFRNRPEDDPRVNEAELQLIHQGREQNETAGHANVPWGQLLRSTNLWAIGFMYFSGTVGWYFSITYIAKYFEKQLGQDPTSWVTAMYEGGPLWLGATACLIGGFLTDWFIRTTGNRKWGRRLFGVVGHSLCAACMFMCPLAPSAFTFFLAISFAAFFNDLTMGAAWAVCQDVGKGYAAIVAGFMNTVGNLGGAASGYVTGALLSHTLNAYAAGQGVEVKALTKAQQSIGLQAGYNIAFVLFGVFYLIAVLLWLRIDSTEPVFQEHA